MRHINLMLRTALLCLLTAGIHSLAVADRSDPDVLAAQEALLTDPTLKQEKERYQHEWAGWQEGLSCHLLQPAQPLMVRLRAINVVRALKPADTVLLRCPQWPDRVDAGSILQQVLRDGWNQPAVLINILSGTCFKHSAPDWCDQDAIFEQLQVLEPDNALVQLLPWLSQLPVRLDERLDSDQERAILAEAAKASTFDLHHTAGFTATDQAVKSYLQQHPAPEYPPQLQAATAAAEIALPTHDELYMHSLFAVSAAETTPRYQDLLTSCNSFVEAAEQAAIEDCLAIAVLMQQASSQFVSDIGYRLEQVIEQPETMGATAGVQGPQNWKRDFRTLVTSCQQPKLLGGDQFGYDLPPAHNVLFYAELEHLGEREAFKQAAIREYALYPDLFDADPARCEQAFELDEATQRDLATLMQGEDYASLQSRKSEALQMLDALTRID